MVGAVARREVISIRAKPPEQGAKVESWQTYAAATHETGSPAARTTIIEFFDFQCPACRRLSASLDTVMKLHKSDVRIVRRHFPLRAIHPAAFQLAAAAICMERDGAFNDWYHRVFSLQEHIASPEWRGLMSLVPSGTDTVRLRDCLAEPAVAAAVEVDISAGAQLGIRATPTFIINGHRYSGSRSVAALDSIIAFSRSVHSSR